MRKIRTKKGKNVLLFLKNHVSEVLLAVLCFGILVSHTFYVVSTYQYPEMDEQLYIGIATEFYRILQSPTLDSPLKMNQYLLDHPPFRPPLYPLTITSILLFTGIQNSYKIALWLNCIYFIITVVFIYLIAKQIISKTASLMASLLFASFGWTLFYLHFTYSETATTAFVAVCIYLLIKADYLKNRKYSILFGIAFALGLFTRWVIPLFLSGPFIFIVYRFLILKTKVTKEMIKNATYVVLILLPVIIFHFIDIKGFGSYITSQAASGPLQSLVPAERRNFFSYASAVYYIKVFEQLTIFFFALMVIGIGFCTTKFKKYGLFLLWFLVPYIIFSFAVIIKDDRYIVPIYPFVALVSAVFIEEIRNKNFKVILISIVIIISSFSFFGALWAIGPMSKGLDSFLLKMPIGHERRIHTAPIVWPPAKNFSNAEIIMSTLSYDIEMTKTKDPIILNLFSIHPLENALFSINVYQRIRPYNFTNLVGSSGAGAAIDAIANSSYLILKSGQVSDNYFPRNNYILLDATARSVRDKWENLKENYMFIEKVSIPFDKSFVEIYRRKAEIRKEALIELGEMIEIQQNRKVDGESQL